MNCISVGTKVKIIDMGINGYIDEIIVTSPTTAVYKIVYYQKNNVTWNTVVLPESAFKVCKDDEAKEKTQIGF